MKARNSAECLSFSFSNKTNREEEEKRMRLDTYFSLWHHKLNQNDKLCLVFDPWYNHITGNSGINNNMEFIVSVRQLKALCHLIKESVGCINTHIKINSIIIHFYTYLVIQSKVKLTHTETQISLHTQSHLHMHTHTHT